jgi:hypothetical protein
MRESHDATSFVNQILETTLTASNYQKLNLQNRFLANHAHTSRASTRQSPTVHGRVVDLASLGRRLGTGGGTLVSEDASRGERCKW